MNGNDTSQDDLKKLGLEPDATWRLVQSTYRRLAIEFHPDMQSDRANPTSQWASVRFTEINEAYARLRRRQLQARLRTREHVARIFEDPGATRLPTAELELRLRHSSFPQLRAAAALLLGRRPGERSRMALRKACHDDDPQVRAAAVEAIKGVGRRWEALWCAGVARLHDLRRG